MSSEADELPADPYFIARAAASDAGFHPWEWMDEPLLPAMEAHDRGVMDHIHAQRPAIAICEDPVVRDFMMAAFKFKAGGLVRIGDGPILVINNVLEPAFPDLGPSLAALKAAMQPAPRVSPYNRAGRQRHPGEGMAAMMRRLGAA